MGSKEILQVVGRLREVSTSMRDSSGTVATTCKSLGDIIARLAEESRYIMVDTAEARLRGLRAPRRLLPQLTPMAH